METIGDRIRQIRGDMSRAQFAETLGIHPQTLYMYEKGKRVVDVDLLQLICRRFDVSVEWLVFGVLPELTDKESSIELEREIEEKNQLLSRREEHIQQLKDELIAAQAEAIRAYEIAMRSVRESRAEENMPDN